MSVMCSRPSIPPKIDEGAEFGDVLDHALADLTDFQFAQQLLAVLLTLFFDQGSAADHDIASRLVDLQDFALHDATDVFADVVRAANVDLAGRQKDVHADVDQQAALDLAGAGAGDDLALLDRLHHLLPGQDLFGLALAQADHPVGVVGRPGGILDLFDQDLDPFANLGRLLFVLPFGERNRSLALEADVDQHAIFIDANDAPFDDAVDIDIRFRLDGCQTRFVGTQQRLVDLGVQILITVQTTN